MSKQFVGLITFACFVLLASTAAQATPLGSGLLGYWQFDSTGADSSGNGNTVTLHGSAGFGPGLFGQGLSLNGTSGSNASMTTNNTAFDFGSSDFTIQVWAKFNILNSTQNLLEKFIGANGPGWTLVLPGGNDIQFWADSAAVFLNIPETIPTGVWQQFVVTRVGNVFDLYWDDNLIATQTTSHSLAGTTNPLLFGARNTGDGRNFTLNGVEDEVAIWGRGLNSADVATLWNGGVGTIIPVQVPVPEPAALTMFVAGLVGLTVLRRHRRK